MHNQAKIAARHSYYNIYQACSQIGVSKHALNRITGNFYVFSGQRRQVNERAADKVNIGLQMRMHKENKEVPGISKLMDGMWYLSEDAVDIICEYLDKFPKMCDCLAKPDNNLFEDDLCDDPDIAPGSYLREIAKYVETLPHVKIRPRKAGTEYIDPGVAQAIEQAVERVKQEVVFKTIKLQTKLHLLYLPRTTIKCPDPLTTFSLFDRVIVATQNLSVPIGSKGTIVSIFSETDENPLKYENKNVTTYMYEVMFDDAVPNGNSYFGTIGDSKVQTVTEQSIINITYGRSKDTMGENGVDSAIIFKWAMEFEKEDFVFLLSKMFNSENQFHQLTFALLLADLANNRTEKESPREEAVSEAATSTRTVPEERRDKRPANAQQQRPVQANGPKSAQQGPSMDRQTVAPSDDANRTKEMLNNIWNSLKQNPSQKGIPALPNALPLSQNNNPPAPAQAKPSNQPVAVDFTESLKKCLKIPSSGAAAAVPEKIQQPSPAQLPPPPANWRIEAQIKHLGQSKGPPTEKRPPQQQQQAPPNMRAQQQPRPGMFGNQPPFPNMMPPRPYFQPPPMGHLNGGGGGFPPQNMGFPRMMNAGGGGPIVMPGFGMPYNNNNHNNSMGPRGPMRPHHQFNNNNNWQQQYGQNHHSPAQQPNNKMSGPQTLSVASGSAFIPLQAARKITKLKNSGGGDNVMDSKKQALNNKREDKKAVGEANSKGEPATAAGPKAEPALKKTPAAPRPKKDAVPRPARIAANFSVKE